MLDILAVGAGGFLGAVCRYLISLIPLDKSFVFPIKTLLINIAGCMIIGIITIAASKNAEINPYLLLFLKVGVCGGFTTFSTFALETSELMKDGHMMVAFIYVMLSVFIGVAVIFSIEYFSIK